MRRVAQGIQDEDVGVLEARQAFVGDVAHVRRVSDFAETEVEGVDIPMDHPERHGLHLWETAFWERT